MPAQKSNCTMSEHRKNSKPIMEKRRRARINQYLNELKSLILEAMKKDPARHSKLEKADILEMTVKHLHNVQRQQVAAAIASDPTVWSKFRSGFCECANEVGRYLGRMEGVDSGVKQRLLNYLNICITSMNSIPSPNMSTFLPSLSGIMPQFHPLAMQIASSLQNVRPNMNMSETQAVEAGKMFGMALLQGRLDNTEFSKLFSQPPTLLSTTIPEDLSRRVPTNVSCSPSSIQSDALESPSFRMSSESLVSPPSRVQSEGLNSSESSFRSPSMSASTSSEKEFSPRKVNLDNSPTSMTFKFPATGSSIPKPIPKHPMSNTSQNSYPSFRFSPSYSSPKLSSSMEDHESNGSSSEDESVWRPW